MEAVSSGASVKRLDGVSPKLISASQFYRDAFAWDVEIDGKSLLLHLTGGMAAVSVPFRGGEHLFAATAALPRGPMLLVPGAPFRAFALVESDDCVFSDAELPNGVVFHRSPTKALLPPTVTPRGAVRWLREPSSKDRWLPVASGVIAALSRPQRNSPGPR